MLGDHSKHLECWKSNYLCGLSNYIIIYYIYYILCFMNVPHFRYSGFLWTKSDFAVKTYSIWSECNDQPVCLPMTLHAFCFPSTTVAAHIRFYFFMISFVWQQLRLGPVACGPACHFGDRNKCGDNENGEPGENAKTKSATSLCFQLSSALLGALIRHEEKCQKAGIYFIINFFSCTLV